MPAPALAFLESPGLGGPGGAGTAWRVGPTAALLPKAVVARTPANQSAEAPHIPQKQTAHNLLCPPRKDRLAGTVLWHPQGRVSRGRSLGTVRSCHLAALPGPGHGQGCGHRLKATGTKPTWSDQCWVGVHLPSTQDPLRAPEAASTPPALQSGVLLGPVPPMCREDQGCRKPRAGAAARAHRFLK